MAKQYPATMSRGIVCLLSAFSAAEAASAKATAAASAAAGTSAEAASAEAAGTAGTAGARSTGSAAAGSRRIRPGRAGARRPGRTAHRRPRGTRRAAMRRTGLVRGSGRTGRRIASAPENGVVHRAHHIHRRTHHIPSPIAAVPHGIQQHPHHEDTDDQHDHRADGRTVGRGRCGRVGGVPAAVTAAAGRSWHSPRCRRSTPASRRPSPAAGSCRCCPVPTSRPAWRHSPARPSRRDGQWWRLP